MKYFSNKVFYDLNLMVKIKYLTYMYSMDEKNCSHEVVCIEH